jgi:hypothetical protein
MLPPRRGERNISSLAKENLSNKVYQIFGSINLYDYINNIIKDKKK